jgi:hypothetical protein
MKSIYESIKNIMVTKQQDVVEAGMLDDLKDRAAKAWKPVTDVASKATKSVTDFVNKNISSPESRKALGARAEKNAVRGPDNKSFSDTQKDLRAKAVTNASPVNVPAAKPQAATITKDRVTKALAASGKPDAASRAREDQAAKSNAAQAPAGSNPSPDKPAVKPAAKVDAPAQGKVDQQGAVNLPKTDTEARAGRVAEPAAKPNAPDTSTKGLGPLGVPAQAKPSTPSASTPPEVKTLDVTKPEKAEKPTGPMSNVDAFSANASKKPEGGGPTVKTGTDYDKVPVKSGTGDTTNMTTDSPDEISRRGPMGTRLPEKKKTTSESNQMNVNKKFNVSDALYQSVMEVMKSKEGTAPKTEKEKQLAAMSGDKKMITHGDVLKARGVTKEEVSVEENTDTPGNGYEHQCAIHVKNESFGEGRTITTQHADPDENGNIAWYDVMFEHGIEKYVPTSDLEILVSESHMHMMKKKKKVTEAVRGYVDSVSGARPPANQTERDTLAQQINTNRKINRSDTRVTGYGNRVTPQKGVDSAGTFSARGPVTKT